MLPDRVSNPGPLTYESGALPIALRGPAAANSIAEYLKRLKLNRTLANSERCQFTISSELATSNWQPDANSILEDFI